MCVCCNSTSSKHHDGFDIDVYTPQHASGFDITANDEGAHLLRVTRPWQGEAVTEQRLAIFPTEALAEGYDGEYIVGAARRIVCMSTSHIAMLDAVGLSDAIVGISGKQYVMNEAVASNPAIKDVGYDSSLDFEMLVALQPDIILMYGVAAENTAVTAKLREVGIPYIYLGDYTEQSPLGKAEWMVAVAEIVGCRERGEKLFGDIIARYEAIRESVSNDTKPRVMFNMPYQDVWYMPSDDSYMVRLVEDAGGEYIYKGRNTSGGSKGISLEEAVMLVDKADIWLNVGQCTTLDELRTMAPHFANSGVVRRGEVYNNNLRRTAAGGSDFWESAIVRPDVVLSDLASIMAGDSKALYYHQKLE
ncbi:MAG: ABC transporter substrate-binding protein [Alistipes sp.]|nr:ABC transporter substrate-binding protein [Alistipes sp.]